MPESIKIIAQNRKARRDYHILSTYEAGAATAGHRSQSPARRPRQFERWLRAY